MLLALCDLVLLRRFFFVSECVSEIEDKCMEGRQMKMTQEQALEEYELISMSGTGGSIMAENVIRGLTGYRFLKSSV